MLHLPPEWSIWPRFKPRRSIAGGRRLGGASVRERPGVRDGRAPAVSRPSLRRDRGCPKQKWGPALLPAPTAPSTDMPVFATRSAEASPSLDPGSPAQASLPIAAARESLAFPSFASRKKLHLGPLMPRPKTKQLRCSTALLGMTTSASRFAPAVPKNRRSRVAQKEDHLFRRLFPAGPELSPKERFIACRQRSEPWSLPPEGDCDRRPDHLNTMPIAASRAKRKIRTLACG
jgi:hypothetical protein